MKNSKIKTFAECLKRAKAKFRKNKIFVVFPKSREGTIQWQSCSVSGVTEAKHLNAQVYAFDGRTKRWKRLPDQAGRFLGFCADKRSVPNRGSRQGDFIFCVETGTFFQFRKSPFSAGGSKWEDTGIFIG